MFCEDTSNVIESIDLKLIKKLPKIGRYIGNDSLNNNYFLIKNYDKSTNEYIDYQITKYDGKMNPIKIYKIKDIYLYSLLHSKIKVSYGGEIYISAVDDNYDYYLIYKAYEIR